MSMIQKNRHKRWQTVCMGEEVICQSDEFAASGLFTPQQSLAQILMTIPRMTISLCMLHGQPEVCRGWPRQNFSIFVLQASIFILSASNSSYTERAWHTVLPLFVGCLNSFFPVPSHQQFTRVACPMCFDQAAIGYSW